VTRSTAVSVISILIISASITSIFVFSSQSDPTPVHAQPPPLLIDDASAIPSEQINDTEKVKQLILDRIATSDALSTIPPRRVEMLAQRAASVLVVRNQGSFDDFIAMLESWGATLLEPEDGPEYARMKNGWLSPGHEHAIGEYGLNETEVEFIEPTPGRARIVNRSGVSTSGKMTDAPVSFRGNRVEMLKSGANQVEVFFPARSNSGDVRQIGMRMIWSDADSNWIPLTFIQYVEQGHAMVGSIF